MKIFDKPQTGLTSYVSFERLRTQSIEQAIGLKNNEQIRGIYVESDGIKVYLGTIYTNNVMDLTTTLKNGGIEMRGKATITTKRFNPWEKRKPKYGNEHTKTGGRKYDSKKEALYSQQLEWRKKAGEIVDYTPQFQVGIYFSNQKWQTWRVDFMVEMKDGSIRLEEVKGFETREYIMKRDAVAICLSSEYEGNYLTNYRNGQRLDRLNTELVIVK